MPNPGYIETSTWSGPIPDDLSVGYSVERHGVLTRFAVRLSGIARGQAGTQVNVLPESELRGHPEAIHATRCG